MKISYLITAYANFEHLQRLIDSLQDNDVHIFVHIDKKSKLSAELPEAKTITYIPRIAVWWGGYSHMQAILNLMKAAMKIQPNYLVLLSGGDYPIRSRERLYKLLGEGAEYINIIKGFSEAKPERRVKYFYFDSFDRRSNSTRTKIFLTVEKIIRQIYSKKNYPFSQICQGSTWWAVSSDCAKYMLNYLDKNPKSVTFFKTSWGPEETCRIRSSANQIL